MPRRTKSEIITFKADPSLYRALQHIPNRSEFIRSAIQSALENTCPVCGGAGFLTGTQRDHWNEFMTSHREKDCVDCHLHLECKCATDLAQPASNGGA